MYWISAISENKESDQALRECLAKIREGLGSGNPDLVTLFISPYFEKDFRKIQIKVLESLNPKSLIGCAATGVIGDSREVEERPAISISAAVLPEVSLRAFCLQDEDLPDLDSSPKVWEKLVGVDKSSDPSFILISDPHTIRTEDCVLGLDYAYPNSVKVGGLASGAVGPGKGALFADGKFCQSGLVGIALSGNVVVDALVAQGCRPIGKLLQVTACEQNLLMGLEDQSPLTVFEEIFHTLSERDQALSRHSLFLGLSTDPVKESVGRGDFLIRNILAVDPKQGFLSIGALLRVGQTVQFHLRDAQTSREDLEEVLSKYSSRAGPVPIQKLSSTGVLLFSCLGRGIYLYQQENHDTDLFRKVVAPYSVAGFFCNGEIGPVGQTTVLHGYTSCFGLLHPKN
ncbi:MAG: FIST C-terminal domain-containing protein [Elusimicrobia bacterium]|nr:FIST C-terminal domain-containing protein [Elusimicrobiota bacterium]